MKPDEPVQLAFEDAFLIAVRTEPLGAILDIEAWSDPVTLDTLRAQICHIRGAGAHRRQRHRLVILLHHRFDGLERFEIEPRAAGAGPDIALRPANIDRRIVDDL